MRVLSVVEARVLAVLVEKAATVPDTYPLSLNSLVAGCNQKTARQPVMELAEAEVLVALDELKRLHLVVEVSGSRVVRFEHNMGRVLGLPSQSVALLAVLMLRGPLTAAERRLLPAMLRRVRLTTLLASVLAAARSRALAACRSYLPASRK